MRACLSGGSENINQYVLMLFALLVHCGIYKEVYGNRLPVGHTHIDIDARHQIYTTYLGGRGEAGGAYDSILTFSKFDKAITEAYKTDNFKIKRQWGLLDVKAAWEGILACSNFSPQRKNSAAAIAQGGADHEPMCFRFFKGDMDGKDQVLMQYRFSEADPTWVPYIHAGIPVLQNYHFSAEETRKNCLSILKPKLWDYGALKQNIFRHWSLSESETEEWNTFFDSIPTEVEDIPNEKRFNWNVQHLFTRKSATHDAVPFSDPEEYDQPDEIVTWKGYTPSQLKEDRMIRGIKYKQKKSKSQCEMPSDSSESFSDDENDSDDRGSSTSDDDKVAKKVSKVEANAKPHSQSSQSKGKGYADEDKRVTRSQARCSNTVSDRISAFSKVIFIFTNT